MTVKGTILLRYAPPRLGPRELRGGRPVSPKEMRDLRSVHRRLEVFPYCLNAAYVYARQLAELELALVNDPPHLLRPNQIVQVPMEDQEALGRCVDAFLDSARRALDGLLKYVALAEQVSVSSSITDELKKIKKGTSKLPGEIQRVLTSYWAESGQNLKTYRDLAQHHGVVSSDVRISMDATGSVRLFLVIPRNPGAKSVADLEYSPPLYAGSYVCSSFLRLYGLSLDVFALLEKHLKPTGAVRMYIGFKAPLVVDAREGQVPSPPADFERSIARIRGVR